MLEELVFVGCIVIHSLVNRRLELTCVTEYHSLDKQKTAE